MTTRPKGWIGVDLDGTLAHYTTWIGPDHIGEPIPAMVNRVLDWCNAGKNVRIFTARVAEDHDGHMARVIKRWCKKHLGRILPVTNKKDYGMIELWDDRCVQVEINTGRRMDGAE